MPRWISLAVGSGAALASILVAILGFSAGPPGLASDPGHFIGGPSAWVQLQPFGEKATADEDLFFRR
jgi:hypothetical protein